MDTHGREYPLLGPPFQLRILNKDFEGWTPLPNSKSSIATPPSLSTEATRLNTTRPLVWIVLNPRATARPIRPSARSKLRRFIHARPPTWRLTSRHPPSILLA